MRYGRSLARNQLSRGISELPLDLIAEARINQGMITTIDPVDIPPGALRLAKNASVRFDKTSRRMGTIFLTPVKPDGSPVLRMAFHKAKDGTPYTLRFTPTTLRSRGVSGWNNIVGTLAGTERDRFQTVSILDQFIFSNNGANPIQLVNLATSTFANLGNAPAYRYVTGFFNRAVGAARRGVNEVEVGWSADGVIAEWDPAVDKSAGSTPLFDSPSDLSDFIKGIAAFTTKMVVIRENSIWLANKQPIRENPFYFYSAVPGIGCDCPYSIQLVYGGLSWLDRRTRTVYTYTPDGALEPIGRPIEKTLLDNIDDPEVIFSAYDPIENEYSICIPQVASPFVLVWTFNFRTKAWVMNEYYAISSMDGIDLATEGLRADQLGDTPVDELEGTADELSPTDDILPVIIFGQKFGELSQPEPTLDTDAADTSAYPAANIYETILTSKIYRKPKHEIVVGKLSIELEFHKIGTVSLEISRTGGKTEASWELLYEITPTTVEDSVLITHEQPIRCKQFAWRLRAKNGIFDLLDYEVDAHPIGEKKGAT